MLTLINISLVLVILVLDTSYGYISSNHRYNRLNSFTFNVASVDIDYGMTPKLKKYSDDLKKVNDDRLRYQQLFFLASQCEKMDPSLKTDQNKVSGCLSTVHVHANRSDGKIYYQGDSDAQLTKGLVALLINGLSGCTNDDIQKVNPEFIQYAGIGTSLTPGRNNGFLNMLRLMKYKANELEKASSSNTVSKSSESTTSGTSGGVIYQSIKTKLSMLKPVVLEVIDESSKHAGHAGVAGSSSQETHFNVKVVASCFEGLTLVQRHKMIYTLLAQEMSNGVHALSISAKTPTEV